MLGAGQKERVEVWPELGLGLLFGLLFLLIWVVTRLKFVPFWGVTRVKFIPRFGLRVVIPAAVSGDEPHYLIVVNSLLFDHSLEVQHQYSRVSPGRYKAGAPFRIVPALPDHHTILERDQNERGRGTCGTLGRRAVLMGSTGMSVTSAGIPEQLWIPSFRNLNSSVRLHRAGLIRFDICNPEFPF